MAFNHQHVLIFCAFLVLTGMLGLYQHIEYAGWVLFIGLFGGFLNVEKSDDEDESSKVKAEAWLEGFLDCEAGMTEKDNPHK